MTALPERLPELFGAQLQARYDDDRVIKFEGCINHEITVTVSGQEPLYLDALDLLRAVSYTALDLVYGPSPTGGYRDDS